MEKKGEQTFESEEKDEERVDGGDKLRSESLEESSRFSFSKNQQKRLKRKEQFEQIKAFKKQKKIEEKQQKISIASSLTSDPSSEKDPLKVAERQELKKSREIAFLQSAMNNFHVILDCSWENDHSENSLKSLKQQIMISYGLNKRHEKPAYLHITGIGPKLTEMLEKVKFRSWIGLSISSNDYLSNPLFSIGKEQGKKQLVYLTSDGDETLETLSPSEAYIIGGIVDRNRLKGITCEKAKSQGIRTAKLPIKENITLSATHILTVNHVHEILLSVQTTQNWKETLEKVVPKRKEKKNESGNSEMEDDAGETGEHASV